MYHNTDLTPFCEGAEVLKAVVAPDFTLLLGGNEYHTDTNRT
jgi:hypothetical protein